MTQSKTRRDLNRKYYGIPERGDGKYAYERAQLE